MKQLQGEQHRKQGEVFNDLVADLFHEVQGTIVRCRVKKIGNKRLTGKEANDLGDVDVLVAYPEERKLCAVESKDLAVARTPPELSNELESLFGSPRKPKGAAQRHLERVEWLNEHMEEVLVWLGIPSSNASEWSVEPIVVVDQEILSPYLASIPLRVVSWRELRDQLEGP